MALFSSTNPSPLSRAEIPSLHMENSILRQKIDTLSQLCENHKSRYEQLSAKYKYELNDQQNKYNQEINSLKSQLSNNTLITQSNQLLANEKEIAKLKQAAIERDKSYEQKLKHMTKRLSHRLSTIEQLEKQVTERDLEITVLKLDAADHECNINTPCFKHDPHPVSDFDPSDLNGLYPLPIYKRYRSPSTINITNAPESFTTGSTRKGSLSLWQKQYIMSDDEVPTTIMNTNVSDMDAVSIKKIEPKVNVNMDILRARVSASRPKAYKLRPETSTPNSSYSYDNDDVLEEIDFENIESGSDLEQDDHELPPFNNVGSDPYDVAPEPMLVKRSRNSFLMTMLERSETEISYDVIVDEGLEYRE